MQLNPLLTGAAGSPLVAIILPSLTPTSTPHPVPQKRQGALPHVIPASAASDSFGFNTAAPAAANAAAAAVAFRKSRLESPMYFLLVCSRDSKKQHQGRSALDIFKIMIG